MSVRPPVCTSQRSGIALPDPQGAAQRRPCCGQDPCCRDGSRCRAPCPAGDSGGFRHPLARLTSTERPQSLLCLSAPAPLNSAMSRQPRVAITSTTLRSLRSPGAWRRQTTPIFHKPRPPATKPRPFSSQTPPPEACGVRGLAEVGRPRPRPPAGGDVRRAPRRGNEWEAGGAGGTAAAPRPGRHRHRYGTARLGSARLSSAGTVLPAAGGRPAVLSLPSFFSSAAPGPIK